ncbi:MAG: hypothetical protein HOP02_09470 [Methylococcaceae bacterium]|nr:hypothetical protein [Methylococcaceae bacterium]
MKTLTFILLYVGLLFIQSVSAREYSGIHEVDCDKEPWEHVRIKQKFICDKNNICIDYLFTDYSEDLSIKLISAKPRTEVHSCGKVNYQTIYEEPNNIEIEILNNGQKLATFTGRYDIYSILDGILTFVNGEQWRYSRKKEGIYLSQGANKVRDSDVIVREVETAQKLQEQVIEERNSNFRNNLKVGDESSSGMVLDIKENLVKIQIEQCIQKNYEGRCMSYGNAEKWFKLSQIFPR